MCAGLQLGAISGRFAGSALTNWGGVWARGDLVFGAS